MAEHKNGARAEEARVGVEDVFTLIGGLGKYSLIHYTLVSSAWMITAVHTILLVFVAKPPGDWRCVSPSPDTVTALSSIGVNCSAAATDPATWYPDTMLTPSSAVDVCGALPSTGALQFAQPQSSIVADWRLVCGDAYLVSLMNSLFFAGFLLGAGLFGGLADTRGRRPAFFSALVCLCLGSFVSYGAGGPGTMLVARTLVGFGVGGWGLAAYVSSSEMMGAPYRPSFGILSAALFAVGVAAMSPVAYVLRANWAFLVAVTILVSVVYFGLWWRFQESPLWLLSNGRPDDAMAVMRIIAAGNGKAIPPGLKLEVPAPSGPGASGEEDAAGGGGPAAKDGGDSAVKPPSPLSQIASHPILRLRVLVLAVCWCVFSLTYYGLTLNSGSLGGSLYVNNAVSGLVELPSYALSGFLLDRVGRRWTMGGATLLGSVCCLVSAAVVTMMTVCDDDGCALTSRGVFLNQCFAFLGKLGLSGSFAVAYPFSSELLPTTVRSAGLGLASQSARVGGIIAPLVISLEALNPSLPMLVFGVVGMVATGLTFGFLPETLGAPTLSTVSDLTDGPSAPRSDGFNLVPVIDDDDVGGEEEEDDGEDSDYHSDEDSELDADDIRLMRRNHSPRRPGVR